MPAPAGHRESGPEIVISDFFCDEIQKMGMSCGNKIDGSDSVHNNKVKISI